MYEHWERDEQRDQVTRKGDILSRTVEMGTWVVPMGSPVEGSQPAPTQPGGSRPYSPVLMNVGKKEYLFPPDQWGKLYQFLPDGGGLGNWESAPFLPDHYWDGVGLADTDKFFPLWIEMARSKEQEFQDFYSEGIGATLTTEKFEESPIVDEGVVYLLEGAPYLRGFNPTFKFVREGKEWGFYKEPYRPGMFLVGAGASPVPRSDFAKLRLANPKIAAKVFKTWWTITAEKFLVDKNSFQYWEEKGDSLSSFGKEEDEKKSCYEKALAIAVESGDRVRLLISLGRYDIALSLDEGNPQTWEKVIYKFGSPEIIDRAIARFPNHAFFYGERAYKGFYSARTPEDFRKVLSDCQKAIELGEPDYGRGHQIFPEATRRLRELGDIKPKPRKRV